MKRKWLFVVGIAVVVSVPIVMLLIGISRQPDEPRTSVREALARQLMVSADLLHLSVPPVDGRYPGAILVRDDFDRALPVSFVDRPEKVPTATFEVDGAASSTASALLKGQVEESGLETSAERKLHLTLKLRQGRVFEIPLGDIRSIIAANQEAQRLLRKKRDTEIVVKSYEAICDIVVRRDSELSSRQWVRFRDASLESGATIAVDDSLVFRGKYPTVVAYETRSVERIANHFAPEDKLGELKISQKAAPEVRSGSLEPASDVLVACIGSSNYKSLSNLPSRACTELVSSSLGALGYRTVSDWSASEPLTPEGVDAWFATLESAVKRSKPHGLVVYWAGHSISLANGMLYLVLGNYDGDLKKDVGTSDGRLRVGDEGQPLEGSNVGDLLDVLQALEDQEAREVDGLLALSVLYRRIEKLGVPFSVLVDGCFPSDTMDGIRQELHLTEWGDYFGPDEPDLSRYAKALRRFGKRPTLQAENPVILAAKPGKTAQVRSNPAVGWSHAEGVGPIAARIYRACLHVRTLDEPQPWSWLLGILSDQIRGMGEITPEGTVTWSQWGRFEDLRIWSPR